MMGTQAKHTPERPWTEDSLRAAIEAEGWEWLVRAWNAHESLLAAGKAMLDEFDIWDCPEEDVTRSSRAPAEARNKARRIYQALKAAIAKAEGE